MPLNGRRHFYGAAAEAMRRILVDHARSGRPGNGAAPTRRRSRSSPRSTCRSICAVDSSGVDEAVARWRRCARQGARGGAAVLRRPVDSGDGGCHGHRPCHRQAPLDVRSRLAVQGLERMMRPDDFIRIEAAFAELVELDPARAPARSAACPDRPDLRTEIDALLAAHDRSVRPTTASTVSRSRSDRRRDAAGRVPADREDRGGRDGRRLPGRARRRRFHPGSGGEGDAVGHRRRRLEAPLQGRAPNPGVTAPSQHRHPAGRWHHASAGRPTW